MRQERGAASLAEILVTIVIVGIAFTAILSALTTLVITSRNHRDQARAGVLLDSAVERVRAAPYTACADASTYDTIAAGAATLPTGWSIDTTQIQRWEGTGFAIGSPCSVDPLLRDLQLVTVVVRRHGDVLADVSVVKYEGFAP